jgi:hypothetical protein
MAVATAAAGVTIGAAEVEVAVMIVAGRAVPAVVERGRIVLAPRPVAGSDEGSVSCTERCIHEQNIDGCVVPHSHKTP